MVSFDRDGSLVFRIYLPHAQSVQLVADFTGWRERPMALRRESTRDGDGWWSLNTGLPEGEYRFSYLVDEQWWLPDYAASGVQRNEFGNWVSLLCVAAAPDEALQPQPQVAAAMSPTPPPPADTPSRLRIVTRPDRPAPRPARDDRAWSRAIPDYCTMSSHPLAG